jgi:hypothetical protein
MTRDVTSVLMSVALLCAFTPAAQADSQVNFKIYAPASPSDAPAASEESKNAAPGTGNDFKVYTPPASDAGTAAAPQVTAPAAEAPASSMPATADAPAAEASPAATAPAATDAASVPAANEAAQSASSQPVLQTETPQSAPTTTSATGTDSSTNTLTPAEMSAAPAGASTSAASAVPAQSPDGTTATPATTAAAPATDNGGADKQQVASKTLQGYVRVVPTGTKIPIIMDTAVDSDTSQEGDEFEARTSEDLNIDGQIAVPAGSVIKGRIAQLNAPKHMLRPGSVALKFDTVTTPDNRQIPLTANLVARGGVVHARRGMKDIALDAGTVALPLVAGLAIGAVAGHSSSSLGIQGGALIGVGVGAAVGVAVLLAKKGSKIDVRPGDELKIELAEDLRMPMM